MFEFHHDRKQYFDMQVENTRKHVISFIEEIFPVNHGVKVLEIGCGEGGVLKAFIDKGATGVGVDLDQSRILNARKWLKDDIEKKAVRFISKDIYEVDVERDFGVFDIIILKDVIEHVHDQEKLICRMKTFLKPDGVIFFGFPPWQMPFGGHQQMCRGRWLSKLPYYHLFPRSLYKFILKSNNESWEELLEIKETGISIERFERLVKRCEFKIVKKKHYLLNPIYEFKFGWKPKTQWPFITHLPWIRNFFTTCVYYLIRSK